MTEPIRKAELHSVRLDSDVWDAVKAMAKQKPSVSLNQYLRSNLLGEMRLAGPKGTITVEERNGKVSATVNVLEPATFDRAKAAVQAAARGRDDRRPLLKPGAAEKAREGDKGR